MKMIRFLACLFFLLPNFGFAQSTYWQQQVKYTISATLDDSKNVLVGKQKLDYTNNSPDTLRKVFFHLYWNAFRPGSMMDNFSRNQGNVSIGGYPDWDGRVQDRIQNLAADEIGYQQINSLKLNGVDQKFEIKETILEVVLSKPILPKQKVSFEVSFNAQIPLLIRRAGRSNAANTAAYSISQWYPKICVYDQTGWHADPYIGREFYGEFGDFDVSITLNKDYILGATGYLQNANQIGYGYETAGVKVPPATSQTLTWRFAATNVHDFAWAADKDFKHVTRKVREDLTFHLLYKPAASNEQEWENILLYADKALPYIEKKFGVYPYKQYSFIMGGDGGMEYPMATLISSPSAWQHEFLHSWYYGILGTDENRYPWMDEGFTTYASKALSAEMNGLRDFVYAQQYADYFRLVKGNLQEPLSTPANSYGTNYAYNILANFKGLIFLEQLGYIVGSNVRDKILLAYYKEWKFKHPTPNDFIKLAENVSGAALQWYKQYWINTTKTIDYAIDSLWEDGGKTKIRLRNDGTMPMPIDFKITAKDSTTEMHYIPLDVMYHTKPNEDSSIARTIYPAWPFTNKTYVIETSKKVMDIRVAEIDPSQRMADVERRNNKLVLKY